MIDLLKEYRDVFALSYDEMPVLSKQLGSLVTTSNSRLKKEIEKLLEAGFIKSYVHATWLANIVPVRKKNGQIHKCVDFRDLNKVCPNDDFPLPNLDMLIDFTANHKMFSFMDGFSGYNQIKMDMEDAKKRAFRTLFGNFYFTIMLFRLKNAEATY